MNNKRTPTLYRELADGSVLEIVLPTKKAVCPTCRGNGTHVNHNIDGNGITAEEMAELGDDFRDDYMNGVYDVTCTECGGANVVDEIDEDRIAPADLEAYHQQEDAYWADYNSEAALRRAESGGGW